MRTWLLPVLWKNLFSRLRKIQHWVLVLWRWKKKTPGFAALFFSGIKMPCQSRQVGQPLASAPHPASGAAPEGLPAPCGEAAGEGAGLAAAAGNWVDGRSVCFGDALAPIIIPALIDGAGKRWALLQTKTRLLCVGGEHVPASPKATRVPVWQVGPSTPPRWPRAGGGRGRARVWRAARGGTRPWPRVPPALAAGWDLPGGARWARCPPQSPCRRPLRDRSSVRDGGPSHPPAAGRQPVSTADQGTRAAGPPEAGSTCTLSTCLVLPGHLRRPRLPAVIPRGSLFWHGTGFTGSLPRRKAPLPQGGCGGQWWQRPKCGVSLPPHQSPRGIFPCGSGLLFLAFYQFEIFYFPLLEGHNYLLF